MYEYPSIIMHMKITYEERKEMSQIKGIFERATIRGIADYLLFGIGPDKRNGIMKNGWMKFIRG